MVKDRNSIESIYKWNIDEMYSGKEALEKDIKRVEGLIRQVKEYRGKLVTNKDYLYQALKTSEDASRIVQNLYVYTHMKQHEDTRINENQAMATKIEMISTELSMATSYMVPEIISIDEEKLNEYLNSKELSFYKKYIEDILREKPHTLSEKEEEILAAASDISGVAENVYDMLSFADLEFPEIEDEDGNKVKLTHSNFSVFLKSKSKKVRKSAFESLYSVYDKYKNTFASTLYGGIKSEIFYSKMRKHKSAL